MCTNVACGVSLLNSMSQLAPRSDTPPGGGSPNGTAPRSSVIVAPPVKMICDSRIIVGRVYSSAADLWSAPTTYLKRSSFVPEPDTYGAAYSTPATAPYTGRGMPSPLLPTVGY